MERRFHSVTLMKPNDGWFNIPDASVVVGKDCAFLVSPRSCVQLEPGDQVAIGYRLSSGKSKLLQQAALTEGGSWLQPEWLRRTEKYIVNSIEWYG